MSHLWIDDEIDDYRSPLQGHRDNHWHPEELPVYQCRSCGEYVLDDPVLKRVEETLEKVDTAEELEVIKYTA